MAFVSISLLLSLLHAVVYVSVAKILSQAALVVKDHNLILFPAISQGWRQRELTQVGSQVEASWLYTKHEYNITQIFSQQVSQT